MGTRVRPLGRPPVAIPSNLEDRSVPKASGRVRLPSHIAWSEPFEFDLGDRCQLLLAYAQVMTEGLEEDVLRYIDLDVLLGVWDELCLSPYVRDAWSKWLSERDLLD
ncbi:MAG: hypothetical protein KTV68_04460 [Acidimicrobiia bacterium]|nr:hypothetical protein [Acidimicrobiia bacterium]MCY4432449.1 hypothetical protein [bacterium]